MLQSLPESRLYTYYLPYTVYLDNYCHYYACLLGSLFHHVLLMVTIYLHLHNLATCLRLLVLHHVIYYLCLCSTDGNIITFTVITSTFIIYKPAAYAW